MGIKTVSEPTGLLRYIIRDGEQILQQQFKLNSFEHYLGTGNRGETIAMTRSFGISSEPDWQDVPLIEQPAKEGK